MKITVIEGENEVASRKRFIFIKAEIRKRKWDIVKPVRVKDSYVYEQMANSSLFSEQTLYVIDGTSVFLEKDYQWISQNSGLNFNLLIWHSGILSQKIKKMLPKETRYETFQLEKKVFMFLDSLIPGNGERSLKILQEILKTENVEFIFALMAKHFRDLLIAKENVNLLGYPGWRARKVLDQAKKFEGECLARIVKSMADADTASKTGRAELELLLDLIVIRDLE